MRAPTFLFHLRTTMTRRILIIATYFLVFDVRKSASTPLFLRLGASDEECFQIRTSKQRMLQGSFELVVSQQDNSNIPTSSDSSLNVLILDYQDKALYESKSIAKDTFRIDLPGSTVHAYWICFQNVAADETLPSQTVKFSFHLRPIVSEAPPVLVETNLFAEEWMQLAGDLGTGMTQLGEFYDYIKAREAQHRMVHEDTFSYVVAWSVAELVLVLIVAFGQLRYLRRYIDKVRMM
ncbi:hypothetical protein MPSEU_000029200 [Mayamaea pseudoterrestris]|nr:hypothetical protein MPSEU_000029200 [Mayamaea pseudoterrestris]